MDGALIQSNLKALFRMDAWSVGVCVAMLLAREGSSPFRADADWRSGLFSDRDAVRARVERRRAGVDLRQRLRGARRVARCGVAARRRGVDAAGHALAREALGPVPAAERRRAGPRAGGAARRRARAPGERAGPRQRGRCSQPHSGDTLVLQAAVVYC